MSETGLSGAPRRAASHISALDSLRGIAALTVVLHHIWLLDAIRPDSIWVSRLLRYSPLRMILEGRAPVILFFVLSGFVLSHALLDNRTSYRDFLIRRFTRIYPPFAAAILVSAAGYALLDPGPVRPFSAWFGTLWQHGHSLPTVFSGLLMPGNSRNDLDPVVWSLVHELRISLLLPVLLWIAKRRLTALIVASLLFQWLAAPFGIDAGSGEACRSWLACRPFWGDTLPGSFLLSGYFVLFFVLGIGLALHRVRLGAVLARLPASMSFVLLAGALGLLSSHIAANDLAYGIGAALLIFLALELRSLGRVLAVAPLLWLGRISYSLYLIHLPVFLLVIYGLPEVGSSVQLALLVPLSLLAASLFHRFVETPARLCGRALTSPPPLRIALPSANR